MSDDLGRIDCPVCGYEAPLKLTKKGKAYVNCIGCGSQTFARGAMADKALRDRIKQAEPIAAGTGDNPSGGDSKPAQAPAEKAPIRVTRHTSDGETTIFDVIGRVIGS